jgi:hypothetical protein
MLSEVTIKAIGRFRCGQIFEGKQIKNSSKVILKINYFHYQKNKKHSLKKKHWL